MDLDVIYKRISFAINKSQNGYVSPEEVMIALDRAQLQEIRRLAGDDRQIMGIGYGQTYKIHTDLEPFKVTYDFNNNDYNTGTNPVGTNPSGIITLPNDFLYLIGMPIVSGKYQVKVISEDELGFRLNSSLLPPTVNYPIAIIGGRATSNSFDVSTSMTLQLYPSAGYNGQLTYLKRPAVPVYKYTLSGRQLTYDAFNSTQLLWNDAAIDRIIERAVALIAENMSEAQLEADNLAKNNN